MFEGCTQDAWPLLCLHTIHLAHDLLLTMVIQEDALPRKHSTTMDAVKQLCHMSDAPQPTKLVLVHSQQTQWFQEALELLSTDITPLSHVSGTLGACTANRVTWQRRTHGIWPLLPQGAGTWPAQAENKQANWTPLHLLSLLCCFFLNTQMLRVKTEKSKSFVNEAMSKKDLKSYSLRHMAKWTHAWIFP